MSFLSSQMKDERNDDRLFSSIRMKVIPDSNNYLVGRDVFVVRKAVILVLFLVVRLEADLRERRRNPFHVRGFFRIGRDERMVGRDHGVVLLRRRFPRAQHALEELVLGRRGHTPVDHLRRRRGEWGREKCQLGEGTLLVQLFGGGLTRAGADSCRGMHVGRIRVE